MAMKNGISKYFNRWVVMGAFVVAALLCLACIIISLLFFQFPSGDKNPAAVITIVAPSPTQEAPVEPTAAAARPEQKPTPGEGINKGMYVQIVETGGDGLRLREAPGTGSKALFLGMESEVYKVDDGPQEQDGYTWFHIVAPYDVNRSGWAASKFLSVVPVP